MRTPSVQALFGELTHHMVGHGGVMGSSCGSNFRLLAIMAQIKINLLAEMGME